MDKSGNASFEEINLEAIRSLIMEEYEEPECLVNEASYNALATLCSQYQESILDKMAIVREKLHQKQLETEANLKHVGNLVIERKNDVETLEAETIDKKNSIKLFHQLQLDMKHLKDTYGDDVLEVTTEMVEQYAAAAQFEITSLERKEHFNRIIINFIDNGNVTTFPVCIDFNPDSGKVVDISVEFYPDRQRLLQWLDKNGSLPELTARLQKTLAQYLRQKQRN